MRRGSWPYITIKLAAVAALATAFHYHGSDPLRSKLAAGLAAMIVLFVLAIDIIDVVVRSREKKHMAVINQNKLAEKVAAKEGKVQSLSIGQIKEVQGIVLDELAKEVANGNQKGVDQLFAKRLKKLQK